MNIKDKIPKVESLKVLKDYFDGEISGINDLLIAIKNLCAGSGSSDYKVSQIEQLIVSYLESINVQEVEQ